MIDEAGQIDEGADEGGLYLPDCEIIRRLGFGRKFGSRLLHRLDRGLPTMRPYPQKDPMFGGRRFWPAVLEWHLDYHRVRRSAAEEATVAQQPKWTENFSDAPAPAKTRRTERARPELATA